jgi:hypothetical protein
MTMSPSRLRVFAAVAAVALALLTMHRAQAGTTGTLSGYILTSDDRPVAGASVTAASPTETVTATTDQYGYFSFVALPPDTYTVTASRDGYQTIVQPDVTVVPDNAVTLRLVTQAVKTIGTISVTGIPGLLRPSTTQDVYSVTARTQSAISSLGGGGDLENAYSAIASIPGTFVPTGQTGWNQPVFVRGGDFTELGYEFDGVPVNRSFDHVTQTNLSDLGVQSLDVYTGGAPADAESQGLSGYVNQVIKQGTYPGFADVDAGIGSPTFFNKLNLEVGGATPDRRFSYFLGAGGYNQGFRYYDQNNGASLSGMFGPPFDLSNAALGPLNPPFGAAGCPAIPGGFGSNYAGCYANHAFFGSLPAGPGGYVLGPYDIGHNSSVEDRENVMNLHFLIPRRDSSDHDNVQLLYDASQIYTYTYSSFNDWGGSPFWDADAAGLGLHAGSPYPDYTSGFQYDGSLLGEVTGSPEGPIDGVIPYLFPSDDQAGFNGPVPANQEDVTSNDQAILKLQYQHDFGTHAVARIYGYSSYGDEFIHSPNGSNQFFISTSSDRELWAHTHGYSASYSDQLSAQHLVNVQVNYSKSLTSFFDNSQMNNADPFLPQSYFAALVSQSAPTSGVCFNPELQPASCEPQTSFDLDELNPAMPTGAAFLSYASPFAPAPPGFEWLALENGQSGQSNGVTPIFTTFSIDDQYRPTDRLHVNAGVRLDQFTFDLPPTADSAARAFWFNAWNLVMCVNPQANGGNPIDETLLGLPAGAPCSAAPGFKPATLTDSTSSGSSFTHDEVQPRLGATFDADDEDVLRFSYGIYAQAPPARSIEENTLQQNLPAFIGPLFYSLGYTTPEHDLRPSVSYNTDFSWEHRFHRTEASFKLTPFYRRTRDQVQQFFIDPTTGTTTDINAGRQTSFGAEFLLAKGDLDQDGFSAQFSYTYTHSSITYAPLPNGSTLLSGVNSAIQQYNSFTKACANAEPSENPSSMCGIYGNSNASPSSLNPASGTTVANPYYNAPARPLLDPFGSYPTYDVVPTGLQLSTASYGVPDYATLVLNYKHDKWSVTPLFQLISGSRYGAPEQQIGVDPTSCQPLNTSGSVAGDPRYPFGGSGNPYDATTCTNTIFMPDQVTGNFDQPGAFREPSQLSANLQFSYRMTAKTTLRLTAVDLYEDCYGGDKLPWTLDDRRLCGYDVLPGHIPPVGNIYNPGDIIQRVVQYPYGILEQAQPSPLNLYADVEVRL